MLDWCQLSVSPSGGQPIQHQSQLQLGDRAVGLDTRIQRERQRIERVLAFSLEVARALRQELDGLRVSAQVPWDDQLTERINGRLAAVQAEVARGRRFLAEAPTAVTQETLRTLETYDLQALSAATRGLQGLGTALREKDLPEEVAPTQPTTTATPSPPPPTATSPQGSRAPTAKLPDATAGKSATGRLMEAAKAVTGRLAAPRVAQDDVAIRGIAPRPAVRELPASGRATGKLDQWSGGGPAPKRAAMAAPAQGHAFGDRTTVGGMKAFEAARRLSTEVLGYVSPRLALVQASITATGLPGPRHPWHQVLAAFEPPSTLAEGIQPPLRPWLPHLAKLFYAEIPVARDALLALQQWNQAQQLHQDAERVAATLAKVPEQLQPQVLSGFNTGRLRGAAYALSHLHARFKGVAHLSVLFPPPANP